jgi:TolB-like protein/Tfp pilus assembly protein PilF
MQVVHKVYRFEGYALDLTRGCLRTEKGEVELRPKSFDVLRYLIENAERLVSKDELLKSVWPNVIVTEDSLTRCISEVRNALGDDEHRLIKTVLRRGYLFAVPVSEPVADNQPMAAVAPSGPDRLAPQTESAQALSFTDKPSIAVLPFQNLSADPEQEPVRACRVLTEPVATVTAVGKSMATGCGKHPGGWRRLVAATMVALIVVGIGIISWLRPWQNSGDMASEALLMRRVAVLPFANVSAEAVDEYFSDGMTDELISQLSKIGKLRVVARTSIMKYKGTAQGIAEIGRALQVGTILEGSVRRAGNRVRITAQLINVASQVHLWSEDYERTIEDVFAIQSDIAKRVADALQITMLADERQKIEHQLPTSLEAYNLYLKGLYFYNQGADEKSRGYFEQAIEQNPGYAIAYAQLANVYTKKAWFNMPAKEAYAKAKVAAGKALELDSGLAEAHSALAGVKLYADWDWSGAEREFRKAIALNPSSALARAEYGHKLLSGVRGRFDDALVELKRAEELDPLAVYISSQIGFVYLHARRWDQAVAQFQRTIELGSKSPWPQLGLGQTYVRMGRYDAGVASLKESAAMAGGSPFFKALLGWALGLAGRIDEAQQVLRELQETAVEQRVDPIAFVYVYMGLGDRDQALAWLRKAYDEHSTEMIFLKRAGYDELRSDARFSKLMNDVGLPAD